MTPKASPLPPDLQMTRQGAMAKPTPPDNQREAAPLEEEGQLEPNSPHGSPRGSEKDSGRQSSTRGSVRY